jgi:host factor-I protein
MKTERKDFRMAKLKKGNLQDTFFNQIRKDRALATIYLVNGIKLVGKIKNFDKFTLIIVNRNQEQMIFKHAMSTISSTKAPSMFAPYRVGTAEKTVD